MTPASPAEIAARIDRLPPSRTVWTMVVLLSLGGFFEFYDLFFTGYVAPGMVQAGLFTPASLGVLTSLRAIAVSGVGTFVFATFAGLWVGVLAFSQVADKYGRRPIFKWSLLWYIACSTIMAFQDTGFSVNLWRFIAGIGIGVQAVTIDVFIAELIPARDRGRAFSLNQTVTFCAVPIIAVLAWWLVPQAPLGLDGWRWVVLAGSAGAAVVWLLLLGIPESPRWLARRGRLAEADAVVTRIEGRVAAETGRPLPPPVVTADEAPGQGTFREIFLPFYRRRTVMLILLNMTQSIGFFGFAAWVPTLLIGRGVHVTQSLEYAFIIAVTNPFGPLLAMLFADRIERKWQIVGASFFMLVFMTIFAQLSTPASLIMVGVLFSLAANIMGYAYHNYQAELYPTRIRARAVGFAYSWSRVSGAFAGLAIGYLLTEGGVPAVAVFIGAAMVILMLSVSLLGPSTRQLSLEQISH